MAEGSPVTYETGWTHCPELSGARWARWAQAQNELNERINEQIEGIAEAARLAYGDAATRDSGVVRVVMCPRRSVGRASPAVLAMYRRWRHGMYPRWYWVRRELFKVLDKAVK